MSGAANRPVNSSRKLHRSRRSRRRDPLLASPLLYELLDKRQLLAGDSAAEGEQPPLLLDLPPVVSATLERLLSSGGDFSSGLWRSAPDQPSYHASNWAAALAPQQLAPRDWSSYSINTSLPSGFSGSHLKSVVPLEENNGYLVLIRQRTTGRTLSGGGPAGGGLEGGGGGIAGTEQIDSLLISSIFHVATQAQADTINPLAFNPASFPSRMVVTSNTQFSFRDTTAPGQIRSVAAALTYQVSLNFVWGGSWSTTTASAAEGTTVRTVNYGSSGTVWFSGAHTYVGVVGATPSGELHEVGFATGSGLSGVNMFSGNVTTLSHSSGSLSADDSGFGTRGLGTFTADLRQTRNQSYFYTENSSRWLSSGQRQSSLARNDWLTYQLLSNPQAELNYTSRQDLAPADAGEVFGFEQPSSPPSGSASSTSFVARAGGALTSRSRLSAVGNRTMVTGINTAYDGKRDISFASSGVDSTDTQGSSFTAEQSLEYDYQSPERLAISRLTYSSSGEGGDVTLVDPKVMLRLEDFPTNNEEDDILSGTIITRGELPVSKLKTKSTLTVDSRGAYATQRGGATPGAATSLLAGAAGYLVGHTPAALVASGSTAAPLQPHTAPAGGDDCQLNFYWTAWKNESESDTTLDQIARFNSHSTFTPGGGTSVGRDGRRDDRTVFSGKSSYSSDALSYWGHAPKVSRTENWTAAQGANAEPYTLADTDQTGSGAFRWAHRGLQNHYAGRGNDGLRYDLTLGFTPPGQGDAPQGTFGQHSGTVLRAPEGEVSLSGTHGSNSSTVYDLDQTNTQDKFFSAAFERTGESSSNHRFLKALDSYDFSRTALGSGSWSSAASGELSRGLREGDSQSDGSWSQNGSGNGLSFRLYELDEKVSVAPASQPGSAGGSTLGGLQQLSGGMDRTLQYKFRDLAPLSSQLSDSSSWTSDFQNAVRDLEENDSGGSGGGSGSPPSYLVNVGDEAQTTESGSGTSQDERTETFRIASRQMSEFWNLAATGGSGLDGSPTEINRSGMLSLVPSDAPRTITITDGVIWTDEYLADGLHRTGNGQRTTTEDLQYKWTNPSEIRSREVVAREGGGSETTTLSIAAEKLGLEVNDLTTVTESLENFGDIITNTYNQSQPDEQIITPGWEVDYNFRTTGKLTETTTSVGSGLQTGALKRLVDRSTPLVGGGWSEHTDTWQRVPVWNTTDTTIVEGTASGGDKLEHKISGKFGELVWLGTEGEHFYDERVQDSYVNGLAEELRVGNYRTLPVALESRSGRDEGIFAGKLTPLADAGLVWSETERSGSVLSEYDSAGDLLTATGLFTHQIESGGDAAAEDYEEATRIFGDWNSQREFERTSNDHFRSSRTRTWTPSVSGEGTVDYQSTDAAFEQKFWGSFGESDTRSVQQGSTWRVPETTLTRIGQYGSGAANPLTRSSSAGHALDSGFYDAGFASWGYEGQPIHTRFDSAIAPASAQSPSAWDDSAWPEMGAGPNLLRQNEGELDTGQGPRNDADQILTVWARVSADVEANSADYYSRVEYSTWKHYSSWYATAAWFPTPYTEAGAAFWSGVFRTGNDVSPEFYAVSNGITRVSGTALTLLLFPWSASTTLSMALGSGSVLWGLDQTVTGGYELATGEGQQTFGGQALSKVFGKTAGNLIYDLGPPTTATINTLRNAAGWFKNILRKPPKLADDVMDLADELAAAPKGPSLRGDISLSGGRSGQNVKNLVGPPNSAVRGGGDRIFITNDKGEVILDITRDRVKPVTPGQGFGPKRPPTPDERSLLDQLLGGGS